uniref:Uncharacterized protein n=1 Tax=Minutocellus polymorphus TaxID=265543 RepID=A0A7S0FGK8_9STRA|mmetsp:Transcript_10533/g.17453  ORF Transcript_10533/g.17453 Transcript_10533/m.17453 type:complete len:153 (+) Transcript_10533:23-481(+)
MSRFQTILLAIAVLAAPALVSALSGHNPYGTNGRQWWDQNAAAETQPQTGTGHFKTHTEKARDRMREAQGFTNYEYRSTNANTEAKRRYNANIAARASVDSSRWWDNSGQAQTGQTTNGFVSYTDEQAANQQERMMEEAARRYQMKREQRGY